MHEMNEIEKAKKDLKPHWVRYAGGEQIWVTCERRNALLAAAAWVGVSPFEWGNRVEGRTGQLTPAIAAGLLERVKMRGGLNDEEKAAAIDLLQDKVVALACKAFDSMQVSLSTGGGVVTVHGISLWIEIRRVASDKHRQQAVFIVDGDSRVYHDPVRAIIALGLRIELLWLEGIYLGERAATELDEHDQQTADMLEGDE